MCLPSDQVAALHDVTSELKATHAEREGWMLHAQEGGYNELAVTLAEGERIYADRIAVLEKRLKEELGWSRTIRVEPQSNPIPQPQPLG